MAQYPCSVCGQRYSGPQSTLYLAVANGADSARTRMRICPNHLELAENWLDRHAQPAETPTDPPHCGLCDNPVAPYAVFTTKYAHGGVREDHYTRLCKTHGEMLTDVVVGSLYEALEAIWA